MRNRRGMLLLVGACAVLGLVVVFAAPPSRLFFRVNRLLYLVNDHRYTQALIEWEELSGRRAGVRDKLPGFDRSIVSSAGDWYLGSPAASADPAELARFLDLLESRPDLAPAGRKLRLQLALARGAAADETLALARDILARDGYDPEAIWWATRLQYDPARPLTIPAELLAMREDVLRPPPAGVAHPDEDRARLVWLRALLALADRDWAQAADLLESQRTQPGARRADNLVLGIAQLEAGRPAIALSRLNEYLAAVPRDQIALSALLRAHIKLGQHAWAGAIHDRLRAINPRPANQALRAELLPRFTEASDPIVSLVARLADGNRVDLPLDALDSFVTSDTQRLAIDSAARRILADVAHLEANQVELLNFALGRAGEDWLSLLRAAVEQSPTSGSLRSRALLRALGAPGDPPTAQSANLLHTHDSTKYVQAILPPDAALMLIQLEGIPQAGEWPLLHVRTDFAGARTLYAARSAGPGRTFAIPIAEIRETGRAGEVAISLLNGTEEQDRNAFIKEMRFF